jgi:hypothetical protein
MLVHIALPMVAQAVRDIQRLPFANLGCGDLYRLSMHGLLPVRMPQNNYAKTNQAGRKKDGMTISTAALAGIFHAAARQMFSLIVTSYPIAAAFDLIKETKNDRRLYL